MVGVGVGVGVGVRFGVRVGVRVGVGVGVGVRLTIGLLPVGDGAHAAVPGRSNAMHSTRRLWHTLTAAP